MVEEGRGRWQNLSVICGRSGGVDPVGASHITSNPEEDRDKSWRNWCLGTLQGRSGKLIDGQRERINKAAQKHIRTLKQWTAGRVGVGGL